jgi:hypothetical protein
MAISDLPKTPPVVEKGPSCTVCAALEELPPADAAWLLDVLADKRWPFSAIAKKVKDDPDTPAWIKSIQRDTYGRHATAGCAAQVRLR